MSGRYERLFSLPGELYLDGAPVLASAGALQKDTQTGAVLAQIKLRNVQEKLIRAVKVTVFPNDTAGRPLGGGITQQYLDLSVPVDTDFGQKTPVPLPDSSARSFGLAVTEVVFAGGEVWSGPNEPWPAASSSQSGRLSAERQQRMDAARRLERERAEAEAEKKANSRSMPMIVCGIIALLIGALFYYQLQWFFSKPHGFWEHMDFLWVHMIPLFGLALLFVGTRPKSRRKRYLFLPLIPAVVFAVVLFIFVKVMYF